MKSIPKIIFYCIFVGVVCNIIKLYNSQNNMEYILLEEIYPWYFRVAFFGNIFISIAAVSSFFIYKKFFPNYITYCYVLLLLFVIIASFSDLPEFLKNPTFFYSVKGIGTYLNIGILFFAADTKYFPKILNLFYYICFFIIGAGIINLGKVGFGAGRKEYLIAIRDFTVFLIWVFPYFFLQNEPNKKKNFLNIATFFLIFIFVLSTGSRSYLIIYSLFVIIKFKAQLQSKNGILAVVGIITLGIGAFFILSNSGLNKTMEGAFNILSERKGEDTRSDQLLDFLSQFDLNYLIQGVGPIKQWYWSGIGSWYSYLDNQILLIAWWAGLPTVVTYLVLLVKSLFVESEILFFEEIKATKLLIFLWILACFGFAIYVTLCSDAYYYFLSLLIGLNACQYTKILEPEND